MFKAEQLDEIDIDEFRSEILEEWMKERIPSKVEPVLQRAFGEGQLVGGSIDSVIRRAAGLELLLNVCAMLIVLVALVHLANAILGLLPDVAGQPISLQRLLGLAMAPLCWLMS